MATKKDVQPGGSTCHSYTDAYVNKMRVAFEKVQNAEHWKNPIDYVIALNLAERALLADAITFFTGSLPEFTLVHACMRVGLRATYRVQAVGYYIAIGS